MDKVNIIKVEISEDKKLLVTPSLIEKYENPYQYIYRMATGVYWDDERESFSSPVSREWSYFLWFENILQCAVSELGIKLVTTIDTQWMNISDDEIKLMQNFAKT